MTKRILCLANSRKHSGRCVAGREIVKRRVGGWVRPISAREHHELSSRERLYEDRRDPSVLDVIDVPLLEPRPHLYQQENWLVAADVPWRKAGRCDWDLLQRFLDPEGPLWVNGESSYGGRNNRVALAEAVELGNSLRLIRVKSLKVEVSCPGARFNKPDRKVQGQFVYAGIEYRLWVTDPICEARFLAEPDGCYELGEACLTISLGEQHENFCYKLIAAIIERAQIPK